MLPGVLATRCAQATTHSRATPRVCLRPLHPHSQGQSSQSSFLYSQTGLDLISRASRRDRGRVVSLHEGMAPAPPMPMRTPNFTLFA
jgi:hypothetical protein